MRTTTGGMGRDPGMLIRIRVVSVVSVLRSSGCVAERPASAPLSEAMGVPYGGVPEGYAAPPRPLGPEDGVSVSRLKAGSPGWLRRPYLTASGGSAARTTILATSGPHPTTAWETHTGLARVRRGEVVRHLASRTPSPPGCRTGARVAQITATAIPPSRKR
ncbi:hypothetical protein EJ357_30280 [Streptomyces cyaneochromogenes]|uniref:Uncharacterized protein n=1 Tax=Streptomyces cyaneochromogenes TaxID=2496836 RepID=A0A3S9MDG1_9ACTN|nr:hypothetical protein EJ357_30280 [Streptomyces cyaneochromogenes]